MLKSTNGRLKISLRNTDYMRAIFAILILIFVLQSCGNQRNIPAPPTKSPQLESAGFTRHFSGLLCIDPVSGDTLAARNAGKFFTPASNAKIFTLYTALHAIPVAVPTLNYAVVEDTIYFEGRGDPMQLHPYFQDSTLLKFLNKKQPLVYVPSNFKDDNFGPGWAWEDYDRAYAPARSPLPLYGNVLQLFFGDTTRVVPGYFADSIAFEKQAFRRLSGANRFAVERPQADSIYIPMLMSDELTRALLSQATGAKLQLGEKFPEVDKQTIYGGSRDSLLVRMMRESDNFLAEQLLMLVSSGLSDSLNAKTAISHSLDSLLPDLKNPPKWVDGSGLSRYNLFSPASLVFVLEHLWDERREQILEFFPQGGVNGTLSEDFAGDPEPYLFAKSGSLGNVYCLSGYLKARSGKILIFSYMNNGFRIPVSEVKKEMELVLQQLRDNH